MMANKGASLTMMKQVTGHRSDTVVQGYIDDSSMARFSSARMLAVSSSTVNDTRTTQQAFSSDATSRQHNNFCGAVFNGPVNIISSGSEIISSTLASKKRAGDSKDSDCDD